MSEGQEAKLCQYLADEIEAARNERWPYMEKFRRLRLKYRTKFPEISKDWPIANASQLTVPIIKTAVNTLSSRLYQTVMAADPLVSVRTEDPQFQDFAYSHEKFLKLYNEEKIDLEDILDIGVTETISLGTSVFEVTNAREFRSLAKWDGLLQKYTKSHVEIHNGPIVYNVPIEDFWIRPAYHNHQTAPWCGKVLRLTWSQIKDMAASGELDPEKIDKLWNFNVAAGDRNEGEVRSAEEKIESFTPRDRDEFAIYELAVRWDVDGDALDEELIVYYHEDSKTLLRRKHSGFKKGRRPWVVMRYVRIPFRFYAEGLAETLEQLQEEISTIHNQRIDNASIANLQIILVTKLIRGLSPGDRLWTGKIVKVSDVVKDVGTLRLGETYPSTVQAENMTMQYIREVGGVGEVAAGTAQPVSRTTATAQMAMLEELNRRFDKILKGMRKAVKEIHIHEADLFQQQGTGGLAERWLGTIQGRQYEQYLQLPDETLQSRVKIQMKSTRSTVNREVEFQSQIAVMNLMIQVGQQVMQLGQQFAPQAMGVLAHEMVAALRPVVKKVFQYADAGDPDKAVSVLAVLERLLPAPEDMGGMAAAQAGENAALAGQGNGTQPQSGGQQGTSGGPPEPAADQRMGDLLTALGRSNGSNPQMASRGGNRG